MLLVISPAKSLDYTSPATTIPYSTPDFLDRAGQLVKALQPLSPADLARLLKISDQLAQLNTARYQAWTPDPTVTNAKQAVLAFTGDVYRGLDAASLSVPQLQFAQQHLRILSGLYGVLRPLDRIQAHRLEMGSRLTPILGSDLYRFWGDAVTAKLNDTLQTLAHPTLINLASKEYFQVINPQALNGNLITPVFKDWKSGRYQIISFYAKKARGLMCRYAIDQRLTQPDALKGFDYAGYALNDALSSASEWVFLRR